MRLDGRLDEVRERRGLERLHLIMLRATRLGNIVSSHQIEGLDVTPGSAQRAIEGVQPSAPLDEDLRRFARAYEKLHLDEEPPKLSVDRIRRLHKDLFTADSLDEGAPGELKTKPNGVRDGATGQFVFYATPPEDTEAELDALLRWYHGDALGMWPPLAAGLFFAEFEAIHPFPDGNGRLGRLLNLVALRHFGLRNAFLVPIDTRFRQRRAAYYDALAATNPGANHHVWLRFYVQELRRAYRQAQERSALRTLLDLPSRPSSRDLLDWVLGRPDFGWFSRGDYPNPKGLSGTALFHALTELADLDILETRGETKARQYRLREERLAEWVGAANQE
jgi:Fic family protein